MEDAAWSDGYADGSEDRLAGKGKSTRRHARSEAYRQGYDVGYAEDADDEEEEN